MSEICIISLGAGVQSSVMALMAAKGEITPKPSAAIFADTQAEPKSVYKWLDWLEPQLDFPIIRASAGNLAERSSMLRTSKKSGNTYLSPSLPVFTDIVDGEKKKKGMMLRQCTRDFKISVVQRESRKIMKNLGVSKCVMWIGISIDEAIRMKPSRLSNFEHIWPLVDAGMSRSDCLAWAKANGFPAPPRSACSFCPYHSDDEWLRLRNEDPESFGDAVRYERRLSAAVKESTALKADAAFLHKSRVPLDQVIFVSGESPDMFGNECEGMCGV